MQTIKREKTNLAFERESEPSLVARVDRSVSFFMPDQVADDDDFKDEEFRSEGKYARARFDARPKSHYESVRLIDHPSISIRSSHVRFRGGSAVRVYDSGGSQLILEKGQKEARAAADILSEDEEEGRSSNVRPSITLKRASTATYGLYFLRVLYTSMAVLNAGAAFVFFVGMLLFLCADLAQHVHEGIQAGRMSTTLPRISSAVTTLADRFAK